MDSTAKKHKDLFPGDSVYVQDQSGRTPKLWTKSGIVLESLPHDSYLIKIDGSNKVTKRNRQFLRSFVPFQAALNDKMNVSKADPQEQTNPAALALLSALDTPISLLAGIMTSKTPGAVSIPVEPQFQTLNVLTEEPTIAAIANKKPSAEDAFHDLHVTTELPQETSMLAGIVITNPSLNSGSTALTEVGNSELHPRPLRLGRNVSALNGVTVRPSAPMQTAGAPQLLKLEIPSYLPGLFVYVIVMMLLVMLRLVYQSQCKQREHRNFGSW